MNPLFIHQNFPAQYYHIARHLAADPANTVVAIGEKSHVSKQRRIDEVNLLGYSAPSPPALQTHHYLRGHEVSVRRGQAVARLLAQVKESGFVPDVILVHPAWGEGLFTKLIFPDTPVIAYAEHWPGLAHPSLSFDAEFPPSTDQRCLNEYDKATIAIAYAEADALQTPTRFQYDALPAAFQHKTTVLYDGINTEYFAPDANAQMTLLPTKEVASTENAPLPNWYPQRKKRLVLTGDDTVVTFVNRVLEPYRGWHSFARAIPQIQAAHPDAHILVVGRTGEHGAGCYGPPPDPRVYRQKNWRDILLEELRDQVDWDRVHFAGRTPALQTRATLQISKAHVYLTYPLFLSYSPVEAMSCAAPMVLSDTAPCREIADDGVEAKFVDFFASDQIADAVTAYLDNPALAQRMGQAARARAQRDYEIELWLPRWVELIKETVAHQNR